MPVVNRSYEVTVCQVLDEAIATYGDRVAVRDRDVTLTYHELWRSSRNLAKQLYRLGIRKGDVVAVQLPNGWPFVVAHFALSRLGAILLPLNVAYRQKELGYMLSFSAAKAIIIPGVWKGFDYPAMIRELKSNLPELRHVIVTDGKAAEGELSFTSLLEEPADVTDEMLSTQAPALDDLCLILFTSGTESNPKGVLHSYRTFVPSHLQNGPEYQISERDVIFTLTPLGHMFSLPFIMLAIRNGAKLVLLDVYSPETALDLLQNEGATFLIAAPAHMIDMLRQPARDASAFRLRMVLTGGSKIPAQMVRDWVGRFGCIVAAQWGMTEVGAGTFTRPGDPLEYSTSTVGRVSPTGELRILDEAGNPLPPGQVGEIAFRGMSRFLEYYRNPQATKEALTEDGFFLTGDLGWMDEQGYLHFEGRKKDIINRGGLKVNALEIEELLLMHPKIRQAAVVAVEDERLGERGCAVVSLKEGAQPFTFAEMSDYLLKAGLAKYKIPEFLQVWEELPTTPSGKVRKGTIRSQLNVQKT
ncbi:medium-chain fatty-acid--CoA ligase [Bacillaceae bacterium]